MWAQKNERKSEKDETRAVSKSSSSRQGMKREDGGGVAGKFSILLGKSTRQEAP